MLETSHHATANGEPDRVAGRLASIWRRLLHTDEINLHDEFFAIGGDSLKAMNLAFDIESAFGVVFTAGELAPPLMLGVLSKRILVKLGAETTFAVPARSSKVFAVCYPWMMGSMPEPIGQALSPGIPWHQVQVPFTYFRHGRKVVIEEMALEIEKQIREVNPDGPYILYGHCFTGLLAYEVAQRLMSAGCIVEKVVLVDSFPKFPRTMWRRCCSFAWRLLGFQRASRSAEEKVIVKKIDQVVPSYEDYIREACYWASVHYRPRPYSGAVTLFRPTTFAYHDPFLGNDVKAWPRLVGKSLVQHTVDFYKDGKIDVENAFGQAAAILEKSPQRSVTRTSGF
jgi:acyl carrier protein